MSREFVSRIAYLIGVKETVLSQYDKSTINELSKSNDCSLIRKLCKLRTLLLYNYDTIERELRINHGKISSVSLCRSHYDSLINRHGIDLELYSVLVPDYIKCINREIEAHIDLTYQYFPSITNSEEWEYIRRIFVFPNNDRIEKERKKYIYNRDCYPYKCYINWAPKRSGNILENDIKLLSIIYSLNGKNYNPSKEYARDSIIEFISNCKRVILCVDCENVDYSIFYTALNQFTDDLVCKIEKIILFDDKKLESGWNYYHGNKNISVEKIDCPRIQEHKSTLDVKMSSYIAAAHFRDGVDGIILVSSDSDYWGLIDTIKATANIFVLGEKEKISPKNLSALDRERLPYCMLDVFDNKTIRDRIKEETYRAEIKELFSRANFGIDYFFENLHTQDLYLTEKDKDTFTRIAYSVKISFDENGKAIFEL